MSYLLNLAGWQGLDASTLTRLEEHKKIILVIQHTGCWDGIIYLFYYLKYEILRRRSYTLISPIVAAPISSLTDKLGFIVTTHVNERGGGFTQALIDKLSQLEEYIVIISPKGSIEGNRKWRSGYYYLAKELGCEIVPGGLDYAEKKFVFREPFIVGDMSLQDVEAKCQGDLCDINPMSPKNMEFELCIDNPKPYHAINPLRVVMWCIVILALIIGIIMLSDHFLSKRKVGVYQEATYSIDQMSKLSSIYSIK